MQPKRRRHFALPAQSIIQWSGHHTLTVHSVSFNSDVNWLRKLETRYLVSYRSILAVLIGCGCGTLRVVSLNTEKKEPPELDGYDDSVLEGAVRWSLITLAIIVGLGAAGFWYIRTRNKMLVSQVTPLSAPQGPPATLAVIPI